MQISSPRPASIRIASTLAVLLLVAGLSAPAGSEDEIAPRPVVVQGIASSVEILRDKWGIPTIRAESNHDLFFGFGYAMASDRLWQMDGSRRLAQGRISEIAGGAQLHWDVYHRTLGIGQVSDEIVNVLDPETKDLLQAFADGVNAYSNTCPILPLEFLLGNYCPEPWDIADSIAVGRLVAVWLAADSTDEEMYQTLIDSEGEATANILFRPVPENEPVIPTRTANSGTAHYQAGIDSSKTTNLLSSRVKQDWLEPLAEISRLGKLEASNIWAVDGSMTESGEPILAMDPHLNYFAPSILYEVRLEGGDYNCWGATFPGMPALPFGANEKIAWGASNLPADSQDLYVETLNPANYLEYKVDDGWAQLEVESQNIPFKNTDGTVLYQITNIYKSRHGPIIAQNGNLMYALKWTGSEPTDDVTSFFKAMRARSMDEFYEAFRDYSCPPENFCVAEAGRGGRVGQVLVGHIPIRSGYDGSRPVDGADSSNDWTGFIPYDDLPQKLDPFEGFVAHANNLPAGIRPGMNLGSSFGPNYRVDRIMDRLIKEAPLDPAKMRDIQMDVLDLTAQEFVPQILDAFNRSGQDYTALQPDIDLLTQWDYRLNESSVAASIYELWIIEFARLTVMSSVQNVSWSYLGYEDRWLPLLSPYLAGETELEWLKPDDQAARDGKILDALNNAVERLETEVGPDMEEWAWGKIHEAIFPHPSGVETLIGAGSHPWGGGRYTVRVGHYDLLASLPFQNDFGAVFRAVVASVDGKWEITAVLPPGEGGSKLSPHFTDQLGLWLTGGQREAGLGSDEFEAGSGVLLQPSG